MIAPAFQKAGLVFAENSPFLVPEFTGVDPCVSVVQIVGHIDFSVISVNMGRISLVQSEGKIDNLRRTFVGPVMVVAMVGFADPGINDNVAAAESALVVITNPDHHNPV